MCFPENHRLTQSMRYRSCPSSRLQETVASLFLFSVCTADIFPSSPPHSSVYFPVRQSYFVNISHRTLEPFQIADCSKMPLNKLWCKRGIRDETEVGKKEINLHKYAYVTRRSRIMVEMSERKYRFIMMGKVKAQTTAANCSPFARVPTATPLPLFPHPRRDRKSVV